ncbi:hypothetical protein J7J00_24655 [Bacillus sp. ISL-4]|uniref:hypothetical protein n=1 Tax=Bacillus sp. ISL-4 TaxID=2819125 RepID=UPI001BEA9F2F|nr:hypothetical protein [Bacillus sp. ISL-4]MBT2668624.1 hypothetical protein [Bacillus sp. ISL-4]MBT2670608.1 hypothetical protein [Streptomyces sp. ISL-14]
MKKKMKVGITTIKKKSFYAINLILLLLLAACQQTSENLNFKGDSESWSAKLNVVKTDNDKETKKFALQFKGKDYKAVENLKYKINAPNYAWGMGDIELNSTGEYKTHNNEKGEFSTSKTDVIDIEVKWNGKVENFSLNNKE